MTSVNVSIHELTEFLSEISINNSIEIGKSSYEATSEMSSHFILVLHCVLSEIKGIELHENSNESGV